MLVLILVVLCIYRNDKSALEEEKSLVWEILDEFIQKTQQVKILYLEPDLSCLINIDNRGRRGLSHLGTVKAIILNKIQDKLNNLNPSDKTNKKTIKLLNKIKENIEDINIRLYQSLHRYIPNKEEYEMKLGK